MRATLTAAFLLIAACAAAQLPTEHERICALETLHGIGYAECLAAPPPGPVCGNNVIETGELCDGTALAGETCTSQGFDSGPLACATDCLSLDTSACVTNPPPTGVYDTLAINLPPAGEFGVLPGSAIDVLTTATEFPFCSSIKCFASQNSFLAWEGMALDEVNGKWWNPAGGGHSDYGGNEIYEYDFASGAWSRLTTPQPLTGAPLNIDGTCPSPSNGPPAKHTYDGAVFIPSRSEVFVVAGGGFCMSGFVSESPSWVWNVGSNTWTELPAFTGGGYPRADYDAARDRVYMIGGPNKNTFYEFDPSNGYSLVSSKGINEGSEGTARFDETARILYYTANNVGVKRLTVALDGTIGTKETIATWAQMGAPAMAAFDLDASGRLVFWDGGAGVYRLDPATGMTTNLTPASGQMPPSSNANRVYSKWNYIDSVGVFVGIDDPREGVWIYRPPSGNNASNFEQRCAADGVVLCDPLDTEGPYGVNGRVMLNPDGTQGLPTASWWREWRGSFNACGPKPVLDTSVKASGTGSLKFTYESESAENCSGTFATNFSDNLSVTFGEGDTFYVQFRLRYNCNFIYFDCDPASPTYRTARRFYSSYDGDLTAAKSSIIESGDIAQGLPSVGACTWMQIVLNHIEDHGVAGYHSCGWYESFKESTGESFVGSSQFDWQPNSDHECWWMPNPPDQTKKTWGNTGPNCFNLGADEWMTIQVMTSIGEWQPTKSGVPSSRVKIWAAREGGPQELITDHALYLRGPSSGNTDYGKVWFMMFMTNKDASEVHPTAHAWFDDLIVSTELIGDPT